MRHECHYILHRRQQKNGESKFDIKIYLVIAEFFVCIVYAPSNGAVFHLSLGQVSEKRDLD